MFGAARPLKAGAPSPNPCDGVDGETICTGFDQNDLFNGADIIGFVAAATAGDACADLAAPFGTIDHTDTSAFTDLLLGL